MQPGFALSIHANCLQAVATRISMEPSVCAFWPLRASYHSLPLPSSLLLAPLEGAALFALCAFYLLMYKSKSYQTLQGAKCPVPVPPASSFLLSFISLPVLGSSFYGKLFQLIT